MIVDSSSYHISLNRLFCLSPITHGHFLEQELKAVTKPFDTVDLIVSCWYEHDISHIDHAFDLLKSYNFKSILLIADIWQQSKYTRTDIPVVFINFFALLIKDSVPQISKSKSGLLLTGKLNKINRIGLLRKLWDSNLLDPKLIIWSFPESDLQKSLIQSNLDTQDQFEQFYTYCSKNKLDNQKNYIILNTDPPVIVPKDFTDLTNYYHQTSYSIISETYFSEQISVVTEKTYRAISFKHPFIMAGPIGALVFLKNLGFKTFEDYLPVKDYDLIVDPWDRLLAIITNIKAFPQILDDYRQEILADVEHNYQLLVSINLNNIKKLEDLYKSRNLPVNKIINDFQINPTTSFTSAAEYNELIRKYNKIESNLEWMLHYNTIKGSNWPNISNRDQFDSLPNWVKQEFYQLTSNNNQSNI